MTNTTNTNHKACYSCQYFVAFCSARECQSCMEYSIDYTYWYCNNPELLERIESYTDSIRNWLYTNANYSQLRGDLYLLRETNPYCLVCPHYEEVRSNSLLGVVDWKKEGSEKPVYGKRYITASLSNETDNSFEYRNAYYDYGVKINGYRGWLQSYEEKLYRLSGVRFFIEEDAFKKQVNRNV